MTVNCLIITTNIFQNGMWRTWRTVIRTIFKLPMRTHSYIVESVNIILDRRIAN